MAADRYFLQSELKITQQLSCSYALCERVCVSFPNFVVLNDLD